VEGKNTNKMEHETYSLYKYRAFNLSRDKNKLILLGFKYAAAQ